MSAGAGIPKVPVPALAIPGFVVIGVDVFSRR
jgi:hypothetical protein